MTSALLDLPMPVRLRTAVPLTDDELLAFCARHDELRVERDANGELIMMSPAGGASSNRNAFINGMLWSWANQDARGTVFDSSGGFRLPDGSMRSPDAAWVSREKWDALTGSEREKFLPLCPEFVIELRSPSDSLIELRAKMADWIANGSLLGWLIDPERRSVEIYRTAREPEVLEQATEVRGEGPVAGFLLPLAPIWE